MSDEHDSQHDSTQPDGATEQAPDRSEAVENAPRQGSVSKPARPAGPSKGRQAKKGRGKGKKPKKKYNSILGYLWGEWIRPLGQILVIVMTIRLVAVDWFDVPTGSMEPTIMVGDRILVHKWVYGLRVPFTKETWIAQWGEPNRGDIVVCYSPDEGDEVRLVKRLVAQGGDTIEMVEGRLIINGEMAEYAEADASVSKYLAPIEASEHTFFIETTPDDRHPVMFQNNPDPRGIRSFPEITVPDDHYLVIGDNRDGSKDSRMWNIAEDEKGQKVGFVHKDRIQGRAFAVAFSLDKKNFYMPRFGRIGKPLD